MKEQKKMFGRRRVYLINPRFQLTIIGYAAALAAAVIGIFYFSDLYFFHRLEQVGMNLGFPKEHVYFQFLVEQKHMISWIFALTSIAVFAVVIVLGALISHRIAGPVYRICTQLGESDSAPGYAVRDIRLRKKDFFPELAEAINVHLRRYREATAAKEKEKKAA